MAEIHIPVRYRTCNCTELYIEDGVIRALLVSNFPRLANVSKEPCPHWQDDYAIAFKETSEAEDE